ncbi:MAG: K(+)/H(+) antiporter [Trichoglossum hirsutum]|nr:MAG: K(+)/H(+) antiporter [Trichoglossum hirsutum]
MSSIASAVSKTATSTQPARTRAPPQGGILEGANPAKYNATNPLTLFIIQAVIIIIFCRLLHFPLSKIRQPRVIAEVIGGILLGPSVMGRIPGFKDALFPTASMPVLNMAANLGLVLYLFQVGLEVNLRMFVTNWRVALSVGLAGMVMPFALGCAIAVGLYNQFSNEPGTVPVGFGVFILFVGVAMAITAFPVLCRILTELKLLGTDVGVIVLAAGVGNDVTGWILLALCVTLVNAGAGLTALWVLLACIGYVIFLVYAVRPCFLWLLRRTGSIQNGPTQSVVGITLLMVLVSAFFTNVIGVHAIFGGFLIGLICPHDGGFAIKLTEKIEDLVGVLFLPLYFALSGLSTNIGLLDSGITWGYVVGVVAIAFTGKIVGGTLAARLNRLVWRESLTIGVLMSCKGLVELIVLNIGLQAKILSTRTFTIFVVMALITTFATTPLVTVLYPPWYQKKLQAWKRGEIDWDGNSLDSHNADSDKADIAGKLQSTQFRKLLVFLRLDNLPSLFTFITLLGGDSAMKPTNKVHPLRSETLTKLASDEASGETSLQSGVDVKPKRPLEVHGLRLIELTERTSTVMKVSEVDEFAVRDPVVNAFRTFGQLNNVAVSAGVAVVPEDSYSETINGKATDLSSDMVIIPWSETGSISDALLPDSAENRYTSGPHNQFIFNSLANATSNTAIFVNRGFGGPSIEPMARTLSRTLSVHSLRSRHEVTTAPVADRSHHIFLPYFGSPDDKVALRFVLQLAQNGNVTATIAHMRYPVSASAQPPKSPEVVLVTKREGVSRQNSASRVPAAENNEADVATAERNEAFFKSLADSLPASLQPRVVFETIDTVQPLRDTLNRAKAEVGRSSKNAGDLVIVGRGVASHGRSLPDELISVLSSLGQSSSADSGTRKSLGDVAQVLIVGEVKASILVVQAGPGSAAEF